MGISPATFMAVKSMNIREKTLNVIKDAVGREVAPAEEIEALGLDSLETLDLFVALDIPDRSAQQMRTVEDILVYLELAEC